MSVRVEKYRIHEEEYLTLRDSTSDQLMSPVFRTREELARYASQHPELSVTRTTFEDWMDDALDAKIVLEIDTERLLSALDAISCLKKGEDISDEQCSILLQFYRFGDSFVGNGEVPKEFDSKQVETWIRELAMKDDYDDDYGPEDILDSANFGSYQQRGMNFQREVEKRKRIDDLE